MEIIDVGTVPVEDIIQFIFDNGNLKKLTHWNSVPCFILAHQITVPNFYKALIDNSETIDATTRQFVDFIVFYGNNASIIEAYGEGFGRTGEKHTISGISFSGGGTNLFLEEGLRFNETLSRFVKYETENVNIRLLSNHMTRGTQALMEKYSINETRIPSLLFVNPDHVDEFLLHSIPVQNPLSYLYENILKPLSICFHEIEEFHFNNSELRRLKSDIEAAENALNHAPGKIEQLKYELAQPQDKFLINEENQRKELETLKSRSQKYLNIDIQQLNELCAERDFRISRSRDDIQKLLTEKENYDSGIFQFKSIGHEDLLRRKNAKRLKKATDLFRHYIKQTSIELDRAIYTIQYKLDKDNNRLERIKNQLTLEQNKLDNAQQFLAKLDKSGTTKLQEKISRQAEKISSAKLTPFVSEFSHDTFAIIQQVLSSKAVKGEMEETLQRDIFICHASDDKNPYVDELHACLENNGVKCWFDKSEIKWGDSVVSKVNEGLRISKYVLVVLSINTLEKNWPKNELEASLNLEFTTGVTRVLPLLLGSSEEIGKVLAHYPILSSKLYVRYSDGLDKVVSLIKDRLS